MYPDDGAGAGEESLGPLGELHGAGAEDPPDSDGGYGYGEAAGGREAERRRTLAGPRRPEDLRPLPFPLGDWGEPAERLEELYRWAEEGALGVTEWYLADRQRKRRVARVLRAGAATALAVGAALPLFQLTGTAHGAAPWGYLALLVAAGCAVLDRCLGLSAGWMRSMATAQAVQRRLEALRFDWAVESVREVLGPAEGTAAEAAERCLGVLRRFCEDVSELVRSETTDWMTEFCGVGGGPLRAQTLPGWAAIRTEPAAPPRPSFPAGRPTMPRQRPPEGPR
jgi:hypothetical protein